MVQSFSSMLSAHVQVRQERSQPATRFATCGRGSEKYCIVDAEWLFSAPNCPKSLYCVLCMYSCAESDHNLPHGLPDSTAVGQRSPASYIQIFPPQIQNGHNLFIVICACTGAPRAITTCHTVCQTARPWVRE